MANRIAFVEVAMLLQQQLLPAAAFGKDPKQHDTVSTLTACKGWTLDTQRPSQ